MSRSSIRKAALSAFLGLNALLCQSAAWAQSAGVKPVPTDAECLPIPTLQSPWAFGPGEILEYDLDALGAKAGRMTMRVLPLKQGQLPIEIHAETNTFFSKVRKVNGTGTSYLNPKTLRPVRYFEDAMENDIHRTADVAFKAKDHSVKLAYTIDADAGTAEFRYDDDGLDVAGTIFLMRQLPFKEGMTVCFDAYGIRRLWRVYGKVEAREHISLPVGEFKAWRISGEAVVLEHENIRREIHVWISDDAQRLPLAAMGVIDLGAVRATLTAATRRGEAKKRAEPMQNLKW